MGYRMKYHGSFTIDPPLNEAETSWLRGYAASHRGLYPDDPFELGMNPRAERWKDNVRVRSREGVAPGVPGDFCPWEPSSGGGRLQPVRGDHGLDARFWLPYLVDTFLAPNASAAKDGRADLAEFTFDHVVNGVVVGETEYNGRITLLVFDNNRHHRVTVGPGMPMDSYERPFADDAHDDDPIHLQRIQAFAAAHGWDDTDHYGKTVLGH